MASTKRPPITPDPAISLRMAAEAIANGTHSATRRHVCGGCGEWTDALYHVRVDGTYVGECCTPRSEIERVGKLAGQIGRWNDAGYSVTFGKSKGGK